MSYEPSRMGDGLADELLEVALAVDLGGLEQAVGVTDVYSVGGRRWLHVTQQWGRRARAGRAWSRGVEGGG
jgi:hypothetical protein